MTPASPVIQGTVDAEAKGKTTDGEISQVLDFCYRAFNYVPQEKREALFEKLRKLDPKSGTVDAITNMEELKSQLNEEEMQIVETLRSRRLVREDVFTLNSFTLDTIDGLAPRLVRGELGLRKSESFKIDKRHMFSPSFLDGRVESIRTKAEAEGLGEADRVMMSHLVV